MSFPRLGFRVAPGTLLIWRHWWRADSKEPRRLRDAQGHRITSLLDWRAGISAASRPVD